jgi:hypothetical protein
MERPQRTGPPHSVRLAALAAACLCCAAAEDGRIAHEERTSVRLHAVRLRIEPTRLGQPGACLQLGAADLHVTLRGSDLGPHVETVLERESRATAHALLLDTSGSMAGRLDAVRRAARDYLVRLDPGRDRAMLLSFDDSVVLAHPLSADVDSLVRAVDALRPGNATSLHDGLLDAMHELSVQRERPVLLLLSDGMDTASVHERETARELARAVPGLVVFTIGYALPELTSAGPDGLISTRRFLQRLAADTDGRFFEVHSGTRLDAVFRSIHETLSAEATLSFLDPLPDAEPGRLRVRSRDPACSVHVYRTSGESAAAPEAPGTEAGGFDAGPAYRRLVGLRPAQYSVAEECGPDRQPRGFVRLEGDTIRGCAVDMTMEYGLLYGTREISRTLGNGWPRLHRRPFAFDLPPDPDALPAAPERSLDALSRAALSHAHRDIDTDSRQRPAAEHARPFHDLPLAVHGRTFFDVRPALARALFEAEPYRREVLARARREADAELARLAAAYARHAPSLAPDDLRRAVRESAEGRALIRRAEVPSSADLQRGLAAWLGDVPAHELFVRWEVEAVASLLAGRPDGRFVERWRAIRRLLFVPSYTRTLTLLVPARDAGDGRIGFWRVLLPRPGWFLPRVQGRGPDAKDGGPPLDLVPEIPFAYRVLERALERDPDLAPALRRQGFEPAGLVYESLQKPFRQDPPRAFGRVRATLALRGDGGTEVVVVADLRLAPGSVDAVLEHVAVNGTVAPTDMLETALAAGVDGGPARRSLRR